MRRILCFISILLFAFPLLAQYRTGNIYGKVIDAEGVPIPGVTVTLTGFLIAPVTVETSAEGIFRFLSLPPGKDYTIKAELEGFKTLSRENIIVTLARNTEIVITMEPGVLEEEITVVAASPVVETRKTTVATNITYEILQSLPTARDPWVIIQQAPGVMLDRENIGGSESGQMPSFYAKGGGGGASYGFFTMDGASIEDPASVSSITYFDFDAFEEMNITLGGADVTTQTGGVTVDMVTRRGGNRPSIGGRFYITDSKFQSENLTDALRDEGVVGTNKIRAIKDYGFNAGGPLWKDKVWWWMSYGTQDIWTNNLYGVPDDTLLQNYAGKINVQLIPQNRFEVFAHVGNKEKFGRSASYNFPKGWHQTNKYHFGTPILKFQDEHMFGENLLVSLKYSYLGGGFNMIPTEDEEMQALLRYDVTAGIYRDTYWYYLASRPSHNFYAIADYFNDSLFGASHQFKLGFEYRTSTGSHDYRSPGNVSVDYNYNYPTVDITGDNLPDLVPGIQSVYVERGWRDNNTSSGYAFYFSDTITFGRFNVIIGMRYDHQWPKVSAFSMTAVEADNGAWKDNFSTGAINAVDQAIQGLEVPTVKPDYSWDVFSPRLGLTYDIFGDGKTIAKLSLGKYGDFMGTGEAGYFVPMGLSGWMNFWWMDDGDGIADVTELFWNYAGDYALYQVFDSSGNVIADVPAAEGVMWGGYDYYNQQQTGDPYYTVDPEAGSTTVWEGIFTLEKELLPDFALALDLTYRRFTNFRWELDYDPETGDIESTADYAEAGTIPSQVGGHSTEDAAGKPYYLLKAGIPYRGYLYLDKKPDYYRDYMGIELRATKRLSKKWMFMGSFTLQSLKQHNGYMDSLDGRELTNMWAFDGNLYAPEMGAPSGKVGMYVFSRWLLKLSGLYQLPYDFNVSFTFNAREGHIIPHTIELIDYTSPNPYSTTIPEVYLEEFGSERLGTFYNLNLRLEKVVRVGDTGRIYLMADIFNVFNSAILNRRYPRHHGTYSVHDLSFAANATDFQANEVLNPRILRFGVRFQF